MSTVCRECIGNKFMNYYLHCVMMKNPRKYLLLFFCLFAALVSARYHPAKDLGKLFADVQLKPVFKDSKTFCDAVPLFPADTIVKHYEKQLSDPDFDLKDFVYQHFRLPAERLDVYTTDTTDSVFEHIDKLWEVLVRRPDTSSGGSLIPLPEPYIVPGGRFREVYYWDSYFTMLGLETAGKYDLIRSMVANFASLTDRFGYIPNGNRTYYLSRSQPPFFSLMVRLLSGIDGDSALIRYLPHLEKEYRFWMNGKEDLSDNNRAFRRVVLLPGGEILNRYYDDEPAPRPEAYKEDYSLAHLTERKAADIYLNLRAACESGWDFSSRWCRDGHTLATIHTTEIIPVDLNCLIYHLEQLLAEGFHKAGDETKAINFARLADKRKKAIIKYCWSDNNAFFMDYDFAAENITGIYSLAGTYPLYFNIADTLQANLAAAVLEEKFLFPGGLACSTVFTDHQWDAPNGWAPLHWISIKGLQNYGKDEQAGMITWRWTDHVISYFRQNDNLVEKYNVVEPGTNARGGEYPNQDGFGWTNSVFLRLLMEM